MILKFYQTSFILLILFINSIYISADDNLDLYEFRSESYKSAAEAVIITFEGKTYNLKDKKSFIDFVRTFSKYSFLHKKFISFYERTISDIRKMLDTRENVSNQDLYKQLFHIFSSKSKYGNHLAEIETNFDKLISEKLKLLEEIERLHNESFNPKFQELLFLITDYLQFHQYRDIHQYCDEFQTDSKIEKANIYYLQASVYFLTFNFEDSETLIKLALTNEPENTFFLKFYGYLLNDIGEIDKAIEYNKKALEIDLKKENADPKISASNYNNIGASYYKQKKYVIAIEYYQKALEISRLDADEGNPSTARYYNDVALAYDKNKDFKQAIENYQKAIEIDTRTVGEENIITATNYNNIGSAYFNLQDFKKAIEYFEKAIEIDLKTVGKNNRNTASHYGNLGFAYLKNNDKDNAEKNFKNVIKISKKLKIFDWVSFFEQKVVQIQNN